MLTVQMTASGNRLRLTLGSLLALALAGCGGGGGGGNNGFSPSGGFGGVSNVVTGVVSAGPVSGAQVCALSVNAGAVVSVIGSCPTTDSSGHFTINLGTYNGPVLLQATHGSYTDEATGQVLTLDAATSSSTGLRSMLPNLTGGTISAAITPLTEIAYEMADNTASGLTPTNMAAAITTVQTNFGVTDIVGTMPVDALSLPVGASSPQLAYALALATVSQYGSTAGISLGTAAGNLQACLASPTTNCGSGSANVGTQLGAAATTFANAHTGFTGVTLPVANFGKVSSGGGQSSGATGTPLSLLAGVVTGSGSQNGPGATALFYNPTAVTSDPAGNLYVVDSGNNVIRRITPAGIVSTLAGTPGVTGSTDATGASASFNRPTGIAYDSASGNLYVSDAGNYTIRQITLPAGGVSTFAGTVGASSTTGGSADGAYAVFSNPSAVAADGSGHIYVVDVVGYTVVRVITPTPTGPTPSTVSTVGGNNYRYNYFQGTNSRSRPWSYEDGPAALASFSQFYGLSQSLAFDPSTGNASSGNILVADTQNNAIRMITPAGVVSTYAGSCPPPLPQPQPAAAGSPTTPQSCAGVVQATFNSPNSVAVDPSGNLYVLDAFGVQMITPNGGVSTLSSSLIDQTTNFLLAASSGQLYAGSSGVIQKLSASGVITSFAGVNATGATDGTGVAARFNSPYGLTSDASGNLYVSDTYNDTVRVVSPGGSVTTVAGTVGIDTSTLSCYADGVTATCGDGTGTAANFYYPTGIAYDPVSGNVFVADSQSSTVRMVTPAGVVSTYAGLSGVYGTIDGTGATAGFASPFAVATDSAGNVYVTDSSDCVIRKIAPGAVVTTLAGTPGSCGSTDSPTGPASAATFSSPQGITVDGAGNVYVADTGNGTIRKITPAGAVSTLAGTAGTNGNQDGAGANASFAGPQGLVIDASGNLYVADTNNQVIRKITPAGVVTTIAVQTGSVGGLPVPMQRPTGLALVGSTLYAVSGNAVVYIANLP